MSDTTTASSASRPDEGVVHTLARKAWQSVLVLGILALVLGVMILAWPGATLLVAAVVFGVYLLFAGILQIMAAFGTHVSTGLRVMAFISGALCILLGLFCFRSETRSLLLLALWIGIGWLFQGIAQVVAAISDKDMPARGWQGFMGVVSALAGVVLMVSPFESLAVLTVVTGCILIVLGIVQIFTGFSLRKQVKPVPHGI
ncbi:HdeD family acid-resistance protein [Streptomyces polyrhachis]|uniref:HdeD family acid-resistance protein n=1 Tax=Streptomyces polyrhachis TaxID=1282885 RepID=A0ABW2GHK3_9ACTN